MLPDRVSNPGPLTYESGALPIVLRGPARKLYPVSMIMSLDYDVGYPPCLNKLSYFSQNTILIFIRYLINLFLDSHLL